MCIRDRVYRNGVNRLANQPTKRFHPERFLYSSLVNRVPVSYTHLDVYKRQVEDEPLDTLYTTKHYTKVSREHYQTAVSYTHLLPIATMKVT